VSPITGVRRPLTDANGRGRAEAGITRAVTKRRPLLVVLIAVLAGTPLALAGWNEARLHRGRHVLLRVEPVDPQDPFRGEYVALAYRISRLPHPGAAQGGRVYVPLHRAGATWTGSRALTEQPGGTFIRGRVGSSGTIVYGIETFFVREGTALRYEGAMREHRLYADVVVGRDGGAKLAKLVIR
jgi:uncharacterized membrane-anchored protein